MTEVPCPAFRGCTCPERCLVNPDMKEVINTAKENIARIKGIPAESVEFDFDYISLILETFRFMSSSLSPSTLRDCLRKQN